MSLTEKLKVVWNKCFGSHHTTNKKNKNWYNVTVKQFYELSKYGEKLQLEDAFRIIYNVDLRELPVSQINNYNFDFMKTDIPREKIKKYYKINGTKYYANFDTTKMTTAQFTDFQNYQKNNDFVGCISVCMRPKGTNYNDGNYDLEKVKNDIESMPITQALTIAFFFKMQLVTLLEIIKSSLDKQLEEMPETKKLAEIIKQVDLVSLGFSL